MAILAAIMSTAAHAASEANATVTIAQSLPASKLAGGQELYLEVVVNGVRCDGLAHFILTAEKHFYATASTMFDIGLKPPAGEKGDDLIDLTTLANLVATYDAEHQRLTLGVSPVWLNRSVQKLEPSTIDTNIALPSTRVPGAVLNYSLYGERVANQTSLSATSELRVFDAPSGLLTNSMFSRVDNGNATSGTPANVRLSTSWEFDDPRNMVSWITGDFTTTALSWSRSLRVGGIQFGRNFSLQPYRIDTPLAAFVGSAVLPSTVDLFINGIKQSSQSVLPGQFQLNSIPSINGAGQAQMVVTDINGVTQSITFPLYVSAELIKSGDTDWSASVGKAREQYGLSSFSYSGNLVTQGSVRYGLTDGATLEAHTEQSGGLELGGLGGVWLLAQQAGTLSASIEASHLGAERGAQGSLSYQWNNAAFNAYVSSSRRSNAFRDVGSVYGAELPQASDTAYIGATSVLGQLGASYLNERYPQQPAQRFVSISLTRQFARNSTFSISVNRSLGGTGSGAYASWSMPFDRFSSISIDASESDHNRTLTVNASRSAPTENGGWGWRVQASPGAAQTEQAEVTQTGQYGQWTAGASRVQSQGGPAVSSLYGSASGAIVWMSGHTYAVRQVDEAFALVDTNSVSGVPVRFQNRPVGVTDSNGYLFVNNLNAYQRNQLTIDTLGLPADMRIPTSKIDAVPELLSGTLAEFDLKQILAVVFNLSDQHGKALPVGSQLTLQARRSTKYNQSQNQPPVVAMVGYDGMVYLEDPEASATMSVQSSEGANCTATLPPFTQSSGRLDLGTLICLPLREASNINRRAHN